MILETIIFGCGEAGGKSCFTGSELVNKCPSGNSDGLTCLGKGTREDIHRKWGIREYPQATEDSLVCPSPVCRRRDRPPIFSCQISRKLPHHWEGVVFLWLLTREWGGNKLLFIRASPHIESWLDLRPE